MPESIPTLPSDVTEPRREIQPGDWVAVYGQAAPGLTAPDDIAVELFSHNEQFTVRVRRDRVLRVSPPVGIADRCNSLALSSPNEYLRCALHEDHAGPHTVGGVAWMNTDTRIDESVPSRLPSAVGEANE